MCREKEKLFVTNWLKFVVILIFQSSFINCSEADSYFLFANPSTEKQQPSRHNIEYYKGDYHLKGGDLEASKKFQGEKVFQIEPSDAIDVPKYSQPASNHQINSSPIVKVPLTTDSSIKLPSLLHQSNQSLSEQTLLSNAMPKNISKPTRDSRYIESDANKALNLPKSSLNNEHKLKVDKNIDILSDMAFSEEITYQKPQSKNNFSDSDSHLLSVPSDAVLSYQTPSMNIAKDTALDKNSFYGTKENFINISSRFSGKPVLTFSNSEAPNFPDFTTEETNTYNNYHHIKILNLTESIEEAHTTSIIPSIYEEGNFSSTVPFNERENSKMSSGTVAGIVIAVLVCVTLLSSSVIYLLYRKYNGKCTSVVESKFNSDNCGYLDDSLRSSIYLNNHIELPKESSEEMSSLDNDSFLNSLETMTIQNYWADSSKNTKV